MQNVGNCLQLSNNLLFVIYDTWYSDIRQFHFCKRCSSNCLISKLERILWGQAREVFFMTCWLSGGIVWQILLNLFMFNLQRPTFENEYPCNFQTLKKKLVKLSAIGSWIRMKASAQTFFWQPDHSAINYLYIQLLQRHDATWPVGIITNCVFLKDFMKNDDISTSHRNIHRKRVITKGCRIL